MSASIDSKPLTEDLSPSDATYEKQGERGLRIQTFSAGPVRGALASGDTLSTNPQGAHSHGTNSRSRPKSARTIARYLHTNHLFDGQTQGGARGDAGEDRRAPRQASLGLRADGTIALREQAGGCRAKKPRAIASGHARWLPVLN